MTSYEPIHPEAWQALASAMPAPFWYKRSFRAYLERSCHSAPDLTQGLDFSAPKRAAADELVNRLAQDEARYRDITSELMQQLSTWSQYSELQQLPDGARLIDSAIRAREELRFWADRYSAISAEDSMANSPRLRVPAAEPTWASRSFDDGLDTLKAEFLMLAEGANTQARGKAFEAWANRLCLLFDLQPRIEFSVYANGVEVEQLDGSIALGANHFVTELRWRAEKASRADLDVLAAKVNRRGMNTLGLFISVAGFTQAAVEAYRTATKIIVADGIDLFAVLDRRIGLDALLRAKHRHACDTGSCFHPVATILGQ